MTKTGEAFFRNLNSDQFTKAFMRVLWIFPIGGDVCYICVFGKIVEKTEESESVCTSSDRNRQEKGMLQWKMS